MTPEEVATKFITKHFSSLGPVFVDALHQVARDLWQSEIEYNHHLQQTIESADATQAAYDQLANAPRQLSYQEPLLAAQEDEARRAIERFSTDLSFYEKQAAHSARRREELLKSGRTYTSSYDHVSTQVQQDEEQVAYYKSELAKARDEHKKIHRAYEAEQKRQSDNFQDELASLRQTLDVGYNARLVHSRRNNPDTLADDFSLLIFSLLFPFASYSQTLLDPSALRPGTTISITELFDATTVRWASAMLADFHAVGGNFEHELFFQFRAKIRENIERLEQRLHGTKWNNLNTGLSPIQTIDAVFQGTPLRSLFHLEITVPEATMELADIPFAERGEHTAVIAGAGHGKTQLILTTIAHDLQLRDPPGIVVIDPTGALTREIQSLAVFDGRLRDRLIILDPEHEPAPALNMFDLTTERLQGYSARQRQALENDVVDLFSYVFASADTPLTGLQSGPFSYLIRLTLSIPGSTLYDLKDLLDDRPGKDGYAAARFKPAIERLDDGSNRALVDYFRTQYYTPSSDSHRQSISNRVYSILRNSVLEEMFCAPSNRMDFFAELNRGAIILVNTNENILRNESPLLGRYVIARCMAAAFERASVPQPQRKQVFMFIDEASVYFDESFPILLNRARQFGLGALLAFQNLDQADAKIQGAVASSTAVKLAGGTSYADARWLANNMRCEPDFIMQRKRDSQRPPQWTEFACYVRNLTPTAAKLTLPFYIMDKLPKMNEQQRRAMLERNRARVVALPSPPPPSSASSASIEPAHSTAPASTTNADASALANAYGDLADALKSGNLARAAELRDRVIPGLEGRTTAPEPRPAAASRDAPRPAATAPDTTDGTERAPEWR